MTFSMVRLKVPPNAPADPAWRPTFDHQPQRPLQADASAAGSGLALGGLLERSRDAGRDEGLEALGRQRVHNLM